MFTCFSEYSQSLEELTKFAGCVRRTRWKYGGRCHNDVFIAMATNVMTTKEPMVSARDVYHFLSTKKQINKQKTIFHCA